MNYEFGMQEDGSLAIVDEQGTVRWSNVKYEMRAGQRLLENEIFKHADLNVFLMVQGDGNMVVFEGYGFDDPVKKAIWSSGSGGASGDYFINMQTDGNLVVVRGSALDPQGAVWSTGSSSDANSYLDFDTDKMLVVRNGDGSIAWKAGEVK